jgi:hypothetical protein
VITVLVLRRGKRAERDQKEDGEDRHDADGASL